MISTGVIIRVTTIIDSVQVRDFLVVPRDAFKYHSTCTNTRRAYLHRGMSAILVMREPTSVIVLCVLLLPGSIHYRKLRWQCIITECKYVRNILQHTALLSASATCVCTVVLFMNYR